MTRSSEEMRRAFAEQIGRSAHVRDRRIIDALARVPREDFLGPPPWLIGGGGFFPESSSSVRDIYQDKLVALAAARGINNGQPSLWAGVFDALEVKAGESIAHMGAGVGYYTAILAELVGKAGAVAAYEIAPELIEMARKALAPWPQVVLRAENGATASLEPFDVIVASAGATHPAPGWLAALKRGGRLCFPLTGASRFGEMLLVTRRDAQTFSARFLFSVAFVDFEGLRDRTMERRLAAAFGRGDACDVKSLRLGEPDADAWLVGEGWFLSMREAE